MLNGIFRYYNLWLIKKGWDLYRYEAHCLVRSLKNYEAYEDYIFIVKEDSAIRVRRSKNKKGIKRYIISKTFN